MGNGSLITDGKRCLQLAFLSPSDKNLRFLPAPPSGGVKGIVDNDSLRTDSEYILPSVRNFTVCTNPCLPLMRVRVSGGHLCEAEAPTEAAAETVGFARWAKLGGREKPMAITIYHLLSNYRCHSLISNI